jgi:hypothetical protein
MTNTSFQLALGNHGLIDFDDHLILRAPHSVLVMLQSTLLAKLEIGAQIEQL